MAIGVEHVDKADAEGQSDSQTSTIALAHTLEGKDVKTFAIEGGAVPYAVQRKNFIMQRVWNIVDKLSSEVPSCAGRQLSLEDRKCCHNC